MSNNQEIYTGYLTYNNVKYEFTFDKKILRLHKPNTTVADTIKMFLNKTGDHSYTFGKFLFIEDPILTGLCNETMNKIIFIPNKYQPVGNEYVVLLISVDAYIVFNSDEDLINGIRFKTPELDCIYPIRNGFDDKFSFDDGKYSLTFKENSLTQSARQTFIVDNKTITVVFGIGHKFYNKAGDPPVSFMTSMLFEFESTNDYVFLYRLWLIAKTFIEYLCYRRNIYIPTADVLVSDESGIHEKIAEINIINENEETEFDTLSKGRYIHYSSINGFEGKILSNIAANTLYIRHLPKSSKDGGSIDAAKFIMITSAFEWEFRGNYPNGISKSESVLQVEKLATESIDHLISNSAGKLRKKYKSLKRLIKTDNLQSEIIQIGKDYSNIIDLFGNKLYKQNNEELNYNALGKRIADQRNHFAHGDLDKDFIGLSLLDVIYLENIIYAIQLKHYGISDKQIQIAINDLFKLGFYLDLD